MSQALIRELENKAGIYFVGARAVLPKPIGKMFNINGHQILAADSQFSANAFMMDAANPLITTPNAGIPAMLSTYLDPNLIEVLLAPSRAAEAVGNERKVGEWTTDTATFQVVESTGEVSSYGDFNNSGSTGVNTTFPQRQAYLFQVTSEWGELELAKAGLAKIDLASRKNIASALALTKYQNKTYLFGVAGLQCYGTTNDPALSAPIDPNTKAAGGAQWIKPGGVINATALEVYADIQKLYWILLQRCKGVFELDVGSPMTLIMSQNAQLAMTITNEFGLTVLEILKGLYTNLKIKLVPEYALPSGELVQLVVDELEGQRTWDCCFTEKMRAHAIIPGNSSWSQKKTAGTLGTVIYRPGLIAQMQGV